MRFGPLSAALTFGLIIGLVPALAGCPAFRPPPEDAPGLPPARVLASRIFDAPHPAAFKGTGRIRIGTPEGGRTARVAFFGQFPDRLRIEMLSPSGAPLFRLATDASYLYMLSVSDGRYYTTRLGDADLKRLISIAVKPSEVVAILCGRPPRPDDRTARVEKTESGAAVLLLTGGLRVDREKILLSPDLAAVRSMEAFGPLGEFRYGARFDRMQKAGPYTVPEEVSFSGEEGRTLKLWVDRYEADVTPPEGVFVIPRPGSG